MFVASSGLETTLLLSLGSILKKDHALPRSSYLSETPAHKVPHISATP